MQSAAVARLHGPFVSGLAWAAGIFLALVPAIAAAVFVVNAPWVRPAGAGGNTEAYMTLTSTEGATLVSVQSNVANRALIVASAKVSANTERLPLPKGDAVILKPGANRVRLVGVTRPLKLGDRVPLTLTIEADDGRRQEIPVDAEVRRRSPIDDHLHGHAH